MVSHKQWRAKLKVCENCVVPTGLNLSSHGTQDSAALRPGPTTIPPLPGSIFARSTLPTKIKLSSL
jgi:hypothetical protein